MLQQLHFQTAEATARLVLAPAAINPARRRRQTPGEIRNPAPTYPGPVRPKRSSSKRRRRKAAHPRPRTRTEIKAV